MTYPVPSVNSSPGPLSTVLHLLELSNGHGAESEELRHTVRAVQRGQLGRSTYAGHDRVRQQSLEGNTHDCESVSGRCGSVGVGIVRCGSLVRSAAREGTLRRKARLGIPDLHKQQRLGSSR
jgi:hypothetical protein